MKTTCERFQEISTYLRSNENNRILESFLHRNEQFSHKTHLIRFNAIDLSVNSIRIRFLLDSPSKEFYCYREREKKAGGSFCFMFYS